MPTMDTWIREIDRATTQAQIVATARDYVSLYSPRELFNLPADCREIRIEDESDIPRWREKLSHGYAAAQDAPNAARLRDLVSCFDRAARRLGEISS
jgi:hypothetical protein